MSVDLPGHGLSSHRPLGTCYYFTDFLTDIRRVIDYLGWKEFTILGHCMGAAIALCYAPMYPNEVNKVIAIDRIRPLIRPFDNVENGIKYMEKLFTYEKRAIKPPRFYSMEEAVHMVSNTFGGAIHPKSAEVLLQRGARVNHEGKFEITRDSRLKLHQLIMIHPEQLDVFARNLKCHVLMFEASDGYMYDEDNREQLEENLRIYKRVAKSFEMVHVEGTHYVHLNNPERVAPHIRRFLNI